MRQLLPLLLAPFLLALVAPSARAQEQWLPRTSGVTAHLWGVAHGDNQWVAVGEQGTILTSPDGLAWTKRPIPSAFADRWLTAVTYANRLWVAVGGTAPANDRLGLILTSPDGLAWTPRLTTGPRLNAIAYGNGTFVAVDDAGGRANSLDGVTWTTGATARIGYLRTLVYGSPVFVATGLAGLQSTFDGIAFTDRFPRAGPIEGLAYGRGRFIAVSARNNTTYLSRDGLAWNPQPNDLAVSARGAAFFNNLFIAVGTATAPGGGLATSFDGIAWTPRPTTLATNQILLAVAAGPTSAIAVGLAGTILQSPASASAPTIATQPVPVTEGITNNAAFTVVAAGSLPLSYQWRRDGVPIAGATEELLFLTYLQDANSGNYSCVVTNRAGTTTSADARLNVVAKLPQPDPVDLTYNLGVTLSTAPRCGTVQPDGKVLLGGNFLLLNQGQPQFGLVRLQPDGALDPTFQPGSLDPSGTVDTIALQPDGKILVGGTFRSVGGVARSGFARLNSDGTIDPSFAPPAFNDSPLISQIAPTADGRVFVISYGILLRCRTDGSFDPSFPGGIPARSFVLQPDGKIVTATWDPPSVGLLDRFNPDGSRDSTFVRTGVDLASNTIRALKLLADGRIMVAATLFGGPNHSGFYRFQPNGELDPTFRNFSQLTADLSLSAVAFTGDGRTWFTGVFFTVDRVSRLQLARLNADGSLDPDFSPGTGLQPTPELERATTTALLALEDGRALVCGEFSGINSVPRLRIARLNATSPAGYNPPAIVGFGIRYLELRSGEPATLSFHATGTYLFSTGYTTPDGRTGGITLPAFGSPLPDSELTGDYTVSVGNHFGGSASEHFFIRRMPSAPYFLHQPAPVQTNVGRPIDLFPIAVGTLDLTFQWFKNGVAIPGATNYRYTVTQASVDDSGDYTLVARNALGLTSSDTVHVGVDETARFVNLATRGSVGADDAALIVGFIVQGRVNKRVMLRAVGPTLGRAPFNVPGALADPVLRVYDSKGVVIYTNDDWDSAPAVSSLSTADTRLGAFPLAAGSADAAGILTLEPGAYSAVITGKTVNGVASTGVALAEIYEDDATSNRLVNLSSRGFVSPGASVMIPAFVTVNATNQTPKKLLIRGIGPGLTAFGVTNALPDPTLSVVDSTGRTVATNDNWETNANLAELRTVSAQLAFPLAPGSQDSALLVSLPPGAYTCLVSGVNNTSGTALVEVYEVP